MNEVLKRFAQVLHRGFLALSSKFAQIFLGHAPTKSATFYNANLGVLIVLKRLSFPPLLFISQIFHPLFFAVKSLEANLVINSHEVMS